MALDSADAELVQLEEGGAASDDDGALSMGEAQRTADSDRGRARQGKAAGGMLRAICVVLCFAGWILAYFAFVARDEGRASLGFAIFSGVAWVLLLCACLCWGKKKKKRKGGGM